MPEPLRTGPFDFSKTVPPCALGAILPTPPLPSVVTTAHLHSCAAVLGPEAVGIRLAQKHGLSLPSLFSLQPGIIQFVYYSVTFCSVYNVSSISQFIE